MELERGRSKIRVFFFGCRSSEDEETLIIPLAGKGSGVGAKRDLPEAEESSFEALSPFIL